MKLFDMHCDTLYECYETEKHLRENDLAIDREKIAGYGHYAQFFALFCGAEAPDYVPDKARCRSLMDLEPVLRLDAMLETAKRELRENADWLMPCVSGENLVHARAKGKAAAFLSIEGAELLPDLAALDRAYEAGVRLITLAWNYDSIYCCGANVDNEKGLTEQGLRLVDRMLEKHMIVDVSHLSEAGFWQLCAYTDAPFAASHSNSRTVCDHPRNLTDMQFLEMLRRGGLVGINLYHAFLTDHKRCTIDDVLRHIEYFCALGGEQILALGADFDGCDHLPEDIETARDLEKLAEAMLRRNYLQSTVDGIFYDHLAAFIDRIL